MALPYSPAIWRPILQVGGEQRIAPYFRGIGGDSIFYGSTSRLSRNRVNARFHVHRLDSRLILPCRAGSHIHRFRISSVAGATNWFSVSFYIDGSSSRKRESAPFWRDRSVSTASWKAAIILSRAPLSTANPNFPGSGSSEFTQDRCRFQDVRFSSSLTVTRHHSRHPTL